MTLATSARSRSRRRSASPTVRSATGSRISKTRGIIEGYAPAINYEQAGYQLQIRFLCTAPIVDREQLTKDALRIEGVVETHEIMTGRENVEVMAVAPRNDDVTRIAKALDELGLQVESEPLARHHYFRPFNHFGTENLSENVDGTYEA